VVKEKARTAEAVQARRILAAGILPLAVPG